MKNQSAQAYIDIIGQVPYCEILKAKHRLCATGLYSYDEADDIIHDLFAVCLNALNKAVLRTATTGTYLVACIRNRTNELFTSRKQEKSRFLPITQPTSEADDYDDEQVIGKYSAELSDAGDDTLAPTRLVAYQELHDAIEMLPEPDRSIVKLIVRRGLSPHRACLSCGKYNSYFTRTILPNLRSILSE